MKGLLIFLVTILAFAASVPAADGDINVIPRPLSLEYGTGYFTFSRSTVIVATDKQGREMAGLLNDFLDTNYGYKLKVVSRRPERNMVVFESVANSAPEKEDYELQIDSTAVRISGNSRGMFYGLQSFLQILPVSMKDSVDLPYAAIGDRPRFRYRGMHLDVARHFMPVSFVKKFIDQMSRYKFNYFHWHLTEDQGWRIEIKKYPRLTEIGSKRPETMKERNFAPYIGDGIPHGGFYTQDEIKEVVAFAKARRITVIPEIELPGHASAALAAYPQFGCKTDYQYKVQTTWGIFKEVFCPTEETFKFLEDVLDETIKLFPDSPYIHIGGDEVLKDHWKESAYVQELKKRENLKDEHEVQSYFIRRIEKFINSKGKKIIGWDEILEGGLAPNATVMSWRGMKGGIEAAKSKHDVIMTPTDHVYFDYGQGDPAYEPLNIGSYVPLEKVYSFEPVPPDLTADEAKYVIGGQANLWTEYMKTPSHVEYMAFPRMLALAEVLWTPTNERSFTDFRRRMFSELPRLDKFQVNYRIPEPDGLQNVVTDDDGTSIVLRPAEGTTVHYTTDGSEPDTTSPVYRIPITMWVKKGETATLKTMVVNAAGRKSVVYAATIVNGRMLEPVTLTESKPGVNYEMVVPSSDRVEAPLSLKGETRSVQLNQFAQRIDLKRPFSIQYDGYFRAPADGVYEFQVDSTWDTTVMFGGEMLIDDAGTKDRKVRSAIVPLKAGLHKISLRYNHRGGESTFRFRWGIKGRGLTQAWGGEFVH